MKPLNVRVLIGPSTFGRHGDAALRQLKEAGCQIIDNPYKRKLKKDELLSLLSGDVSGLIAGLETLDRDVLSKTKLKVISRSGAGLSNVDLKAAGELGIKVRYTPDAPTTSVAEVTVAAMLNLLRQLPQMNSDLHSGIWQKQVGMQMEGKTVAIIGFGRIGRKVASLLSPFGVSILAVDPLLSENGFLDNVQACSLAQALGKADIVTVHSSRDEQIIGASEFKLMRDGVLLLNSARGKVINEEALIQALEDKKVRGAWIDTFAVEPYSGRLQEYPQVILTPHIGSYTLECRRNMEMQAVNNLIAAFKENNDES